MNVHQAAHGLHIASASRVFFVNPVWQPNVEAQATKRAHRIGQTRPVYVETLVLKDTLEDQMLQRRKGMTAQEHQKAERSLLDDDTMSTIIKNARFIPLLEDEIHDVSKQVAKLQTPQQLFGRPGKGHGDVDDPDADLIFPTNSPTSKKSQKRKSNAGPPGYLTASPPPTLSTANVGFTDRGVANLSELLSRKGKSDSEYGPDLDESSPPPRRRTVIFDPLNGGDAGPSGSLTSEPIANEPLQGEAVYASSNAGGSGRRVGFDLGGGDEEPRSLFGGDGSASG